MKTITQQRILAKLLRLAEIARDRNDPPTDCSVDENDFWVTHFADIPEFDDFDDMYDYLGVGMYERR
jgi:hypothetical protein